MSIPFADPAAQWAEESGELLPRMEEVLATGVTVGGPEVEALETELSAFLGAREVVGLASGSDALTLGIKALGIGPGAEVIAPPNAFFGSIAAILAQGARPVLVDVQDDGTLDADKVERAVTPATRAVLAVHPAGILGDIESLLLLVRDRDLALIEDAALAMGAGHRGRSAGTIGEIGCFAAGPGMPLGAMGDAGFVATDDPELADRLRLFRNYGLVGRNTVAEFAGCSRMDAIQAAVLRFRLKRLSGILDARRHNAGRLAELLAGIGHLRLPSLPFSCHALVVQAERRDDLHDFLLAQGVGCLMESSVPVHLQPAARGLGYRYGSFPVAESLAENSLSLPVHQFLDEEYLQRIADAIRGFYARGG